MDVRKIVDSLAAIRAPTSSKNHIKVILDGLSNDYDLFITVISLRDLYIDLKSLHRSQTYC